jgi:hypothetical protein
LGGGCAGPGTSYGAAQSTTSSTFVNSLPNTYAGEYNTYNVTSGQQYEWSLCPADGAVNPTSDAQLTLKNTSNGNICYSDDLCGAQPKILWTATFTGQIQIATLLDGDVFLVVLLQVLQVVQTLQRLEVRQHQQITFLLPSVLVRIRTNTIQLLV